MSFMGWQKELYEGKNSGITRDIYTLREMFFKVRRYAWMCERCEIVCADVNYMTESVMRKS